MQTSTSVQLHNHKTQIPQQIIQVTSQTPTVNIPQPIQHTNTPIEPTGHNLRT